MSGNVSENNRPTPIFNLRSEPSNPLNAQLYIFDDISNTLPEEYREYAGSREDLISLFNGTYDSLCRGEIGEGYIKDKVSASNIMIGYCIEGETENNGNNNYYTTIKPLGLLLGRYTESNNIIIDLICTDQEYKGVGKQLISIIKEIAAAKGISSLQLSSVKPAKSFYTKYNFSNNGARNETTGLTPMKYNMSKYTKKGGRRRTTKPKKRPSKTRHRK